MLPCGAACSAGVYLMPSDRFIGVHAVVATADAAANIRFHVETAREFRRQFLRAHVCGVSCVQERCACWFLCAYVVVAFYFFKNVFRVCGRTRFGCVVVDVVVVV